MLIDGFDQLAEALEEDLGPLISVSRLRPNRALDGHDVLSGDDLEALVLTFAHDVLTLRAVGADDTLAVAVGTDHGFGAPVTADISHEPPWNEAVGKKLWTA